MTDRSAGPAATALRVASPADPVRTTRTAEQVGARGVPGARLQEDLPAPRELAPVTPATAAAAVRRRGAGTQDGRSRGGRTRGGRRAVVPRRAERHEVRPGPVMRLLVRGVVDAVPAPGRGVRAARLPADRTTRGRTPVVADVLRVATHGPTVPELSVVAGRTTAPSASVAVGLPPAGGLLEVVAVSAAPQPKVSAAATGRAGPVPPQGGPRAPVSVAPTVTGTAHNARTVRGVIGPRTVTAAGVDNGPTVLGLIGPRTVTAAGVDNAPTVSGVIGPRTVTAAGAENARMVSGVIGRRTATATAVVSGPTRRGVSVPPTAQAAVTAGPPAAGGGRGAGRSRSGGARGSVHSG